MNRESESLVWKIGLEDSRWDADGCGDSRSICRRGCDTSDCKYWVREKVDSGDIRAVLSARVLYDFACEMVRCQLRRLRLGGKVEPYASTSKITRDIDSW